MERTSPKNQELMRFAYADPPYLGLAHYYDHPDTAKWNTIGAHKELIEGLSLGFPDGWAISLHSPSLKYILPLCPEVARVAAWVKPFASFKPGINPAYTWEPVIFMGGRKRDRQSETVRDFLSCPIALRKGLVGAKPPAFCRWICDLLGYQEGDELIDLFPGTGSMSTCLSQTKLAL